VTHTWDNTELDVSNTNLSWATLPVCVLSFHLCLRSPDGAVFVWLARHTWRAIKPIPPLARHPHLTLLPSHLCGVPPSFLTSLFSPLLAVRLHNKVTVTSMLYNNLLTVHSPRLTEASPHFLKILNLLYLIASAFFVCSRIWNCVSSCQTAEQLQQFHFFSENWIQWNMDS